MDTTVYNACDQCTAARAYVFVTLSNGGELVYCGHCYRINADALLYSGAFVVADLREPAVSPTPEPDLT